MLVSRTKFFQYQNIFYKKLLNTPYKIRLEVVTIQKVEPTEEFSMDAFVGDSPRTSEFMSSKHSMKRRFQTAPVRNMVCPKK